MASSSALSSCAAMVSTVSQKIISWDGSGITGQRALGEPDPGQAAELPVVEHVAQRGLGVRRDQREGLLGGEPALRGALVVTAGGREQVPGGVQGRTGGEPQLGLGLGERLGVVGQRVQEDIGALAGEVADRRGMHPGIQHPGAYGVDAERGEADQAVAGDVLVGERLGGGLTGSTRGEGRLAVLVQLLDERLVDGLVGDQTDRLQHPELVVQAHHRLGDLFEDVVGGLLHIVRDDHGGGQRGQRNLLVGALVQGGEQIEVAEDAVEQLGLLLRVPVDRVQVQFAALGELVGEIGEIGGGRVGEHGLHTAEPDVEDVLRAAGGEQAQLVAGGGGAGRGVVGEVRAVLAVGGLLDLHESGVHRQLPGLGGVGGAVLVTGQAEVLGGGGQRLFEDLAADADRDAPLGPAGELRGPGQQGGAQRLAGQFRFGVQPHRRQGGAVCGHRVLSSSDGLRARCAAQA